MRNNDKIAYNPKLKELAKQLRKSGNLSEVLLWHQLKGSKMLGFDFHRQKPIDNYIVDFFCSKLMLAIEIDGCTHDNKFEYDLQRERRLNILGIKVLRFQDKDVKDNLAGVLTAIEQWIMQNSNTPRPSGTPLARGE